ncbi:DUF1453 domain-containing protein [Clavibacter sp. Sh2126]|uniref:DUF1453 domain-containing protein n=1 Tax=Clavibacter sp. Sh2126 TaxID=3397678 RepID=UPI0039E08A30
MDVSDALVSVALILLVVRQLRGRRLTLLSLLWPVLLVTWAGVEYLGAVAPFASDHAFVAGLGALGATLGVACGLLTRVEARAGVVVARASWLAAAAWIAGMGGRLAFGLIALHGGGRIIAEASVRLDLHAAGTWSTALITMALAEVVARTAVLAARHRTITRRIAGERGDGRRASAAALATPADDGGPEG